ncbi:MAG: CvpA family protein [Cytophagaceae bacterium]
MKIIDIILLLLLLLGAYKGYKKGFVQEILSFAALIIAIVASFKFLNWGIDQLKEYISDSNLLIFSAFLLIFIGVLVGMYFLSRILKKIIDLTLLGSIDNLAGALFGMAKVGFIASTLLWLLSEAQLFSFDTYIQGSILFPPVIDFAPTTVHWITKVVPFQDVFPIIKEYLGPL